MTALTFNEAEHTYWLGDRRLPSVTEILRPLYGDLRFVSEDLLDWKSELGRAVHKAVELHVNGELEYSSLVSPVAEYFEQYLAFEVDTGFEPVASEVRVHSALGFAGTLDLAGRLRQHALGIVDLKCTASLSPAVRLQTAAYRHGYAETTGTDARLLKRYALRLSPTRYSLTPYRPETDATDFGAFLGLLKAHQWCAANGASLSEIVSHE